MPDKKSSEQNGIEQAIENMETWSYGIDLTDTPHGWFSNNWVLTGEATSSTEAGSHHIQWQNPPKITRAKQKNPNG